MLWIGLLVIVIVVGLSFVASFARRIPPEGDSARNDPDSGSGDH